MNDELIGLWFLFLLVAIGVSIPVAFSLEKRVKARLPHTQPYKWGFYTGCMGVACAPLALLFLAVIPTAKTSDETLGCFALAAWLGVHGVSGWFIIKRKR